MPPPSLRDAMGHGKTKCDNSQKHVGPFFTITIVAHEVGKATRSAGRKRIQARRVVGRLCADCVLKSRFQIDGSKVLLDESQTRGKEKRQREALRAA